ncbi:dihydrolipoyl dehydrogenase [Brevundimonas sp. NIBR11]|uniref:dihydrolipoyl dehydrogenase n=1 Tax=Brevundimonas sp. NIBR11 TaxID=3015999 RepID=UPI0022F06F2A|nr:dihydrolipoyl dehydrogenase [Brevundimonas sp. NIBR11]WGM30595.1 Dihydrolipoyl dehydrogenase [Brevundimonas sp. NIBR11]
MLKPAACDVAVIGAGSAGLAAYHAAKATGAKVLLIEAGPGGTTCARYGCMPSKLLLAAARAARDAREAATFGICVGDFAIDGTAVMTRVQRERDHFVAGVLEEVAAIPPSDRLHGRARFAGPDTLTVDDHTRVSARSIVIATGARPVVPTDLAETCQERVVTHETVFDLETLPRALAVIGAGPLGLELALAFVRLGVKTTIFDEGDSIGAVRDPVVAEAVADQLKRELIFELGVTVEAKRKADGDILLHWTEAGGKARRGTFDYVLVATGRTPALDGLDLNLAGLDCDEDGVPVFDPDTLRCGRSNIFIAGDANDDRPVLHEASLQGELASRNAAHAPKLEKRTPMPQMAVVYSDPDIATVGPGWDKDAAEGWIIGCSDDVGRARVDGRPSGILRIYAGAGDGVLLGGELFGPDVEHLAHLLAWAVQLKMTARDVLALPFYHPTMEESLRTALRNLADQQKG